jgi:hypothetical protein
LNRNERDHRDNRDNRPEYQNDSDGPHN